ncbi:PAS domain-containing protein [Pusillimonas minor]|uniref:PAS domain-containing protein n=1 Tax=Pusillimonas minor TaxID=2697024 RepID=A0A842HUD2_9BURK|nr:PAS domain-containing protein [Pusillimonas minor]MBC2771030.1 PAS domain-containing protein [Pusillimonas minor]
MPTLTDNQRDMAEALPSMIWTATPNGQVDYVNHVFEHYTGRPADQGGVIDWLAVVHPDDHAPTSRIWANCIASGAKYQAEFRIFHQPSNSYRWHHVAATPALQPRRHNSALVRHHHRHPRHQAGQSGC